MKENRVFLKKGTQLKLGDITYEILKMAGCGTNAVVYLASYRDTLLLSARHRVLIKELYPLRKEGGIIRGEYGTDIEVYPEAAEFFWHHADSFLRGNAIWLDLLLKEPELISGNLNSYEVGGTLYSVLAWQGGETLEQALEDGKIRTLHQAVSVIKNLLDSLKAFHKNDCICLDISRTIFFCYPPAKTRLSLTGSGRMGARS